MNTFIRDEFDQDLRHRFELFDVILIAAELVILFSFFNYTLSGSESGYRSAQLLWHDMGWLDRLHRLRPGGAVPARTERCDQGLERAFPQRGRGSAGTDGRLHAAPLFHVCRRLFLSMVNNPLASNSFLPPCRGKARMGVELCNDNASTPTLTLPLQGGGDRIASVGLEQ